MKAIRHIALVDPLWGGHHPTYLKAYVRALHRNGYRVAVLTKGSDEIPSLAFDGTLSDRVHVFQYELPPDEAGTIHTGGFNKDERSKIAAAREYPPDNMLIIDRRIEDGPLGDAIDRIAPGIRHGI